jgi:hypothetical protein
MQPRPKLRFWQLSLRTLLLAITLICIASGVYAHWMQPRRLELLVEEFNKTIDERRYDDAYKIALEAKRGYPKHPVSELLVAKADFAKQIATNTAPACGTGSWRGGCIGYSSEDIPSEPQMTYMDPKKWEAIADKSKQR